MSYTALRNSYVLVECRKDNTQVLGPVITNLTSLRTGEKVDRWRDKISKNIQAGSPYQTDSTRVVKRSDGAVNLRWVNHFTPGIIITEKWTGQAQTLTPVAHLTTSTTASENAALKKIIKKVRQESSHLNGSAFTGELREAIHGLRHPFQLLREQTAAHLDTLGKRKRGLAKLPPTKRKKAWREVVAGTWLEYSFGLRPLMHDVKEIAEAVGRFQYEPPRKARLQTRASDTQGQIIYTTSDLSSGYLRVMREKAIETTSFCSYSVGMETNVQCAFGAAGRLLEVLGFTPENFIPTLYELMPWSWLIDYFSNLGELIEAGTTSTTNVRWIVKTKGVKTEVLYLNIPNADESKKVIVAGGDKFIDLTGSTHLGQLLVSRATLDRSLPLSFGMPALSLSLPGRPTQFANLVAVLAQFSGKTYDPSMARRVRAPYGTLRERSRGVRDVSDFLN
jgi:hypothetical protein